MFEMPRRTSLVADLFTTQQQRDDAQLERVLVLPLSEINDFPNHPFKVRMDEEMQEMVESVKEHGVLVPVLARPLESGGYEMVAGHRRKKACVLAGRDTMPVIVRRLTDDEATTLM
jgi:ParB family chromosome partitioning protein